MKKAGVLAIASLALASCDMDPAAEYESKLDNLNSSWNTLGDGSDFAMVNDPDRGRRIAMRCWLQSSGSHTCVSVEEVTGAFSRTTVSRSIETKLPEVLWGLSGDGYRCQFAIGITEEVADGADALISNRLQETGRPWQPQFVNDYIRQNNVRGSGHFRCLEVLRAIRDGSLKTLGTTSVTEAMAN